MLMAADTSRRNSAEIGFPRRACCSEVRSGVQLADPSPRTCQRLSGRKCVSGSCLPATRGDRGRLRGAVRRGQRLFDAASPGIVADPYGPAHYASIADVLDLSATIAQSARRSELARRMTRSVATTRSLDAGPGVGSGQPVCCRPGEISIHGLPSMPASDRIAP